MRNRACRKCGDYVPYRAKINGSIRSLQNRKFCLKCSPFGSRNTSKYDPVERQHGDTYAKHSDRRKEAIKLCLYKKALSRKTTLIQQKGGKCQNCGYNRCQRALSFHHRNPSSKCFGLSLNNLWSKNMQQIQNEAEKCDLLCANCHMEIEDKQTNIKERVNAKYGTFF